MWKLIKQYRFYISLFLFLLIPIVAIDTTTRQPKDYSWVDKTIVSLTSPLQSLIRWSLDNSIRVFENYIYLFTTKHENLLLHEENRKLLSTIASMREIEQENLRLKKLLNFKEVIKTSTITARVIAKDVSTEFRAIRINRGSEAGVQKNMSVVTHEGIVGKVLRVTPNTADVITILDLLSAVDAIVERSRAHGIIEGYTDDLCQLKYTLRTDDIILGDILVSSGLGGVFPKGIPLGIVSKVNKKAFGISQEIEVRPSVDFSKLEEVLVIKEVAEDSHSGAELPEETKEKP